MPANAKSIALTVGASTARSSKHVLYRSGGCQTYYMSSSKAKVPPTKAQNEHAFQTFLGDVLP